MIPPIRHGSTAGLPCHSCLAQSTETSFGAPCTCHQLLELPSILCHDSLCNLTRLIQRFGGSFPAQRVKTASSFFTTFAISFPVGSLGEEFGWRGVMAPYLNTLIDRKFGGSRFWKWTPAIQSLITGVFWAVCVGPNKTFDTTFICNSGLACSCFLCQWCQPKQVQFLAISNARAHVSFRASGFQFWMV